MAMIDTAHAAPFGAITIHRGIIEPASRLIAWLRERSEAARTAAALSRLTPAQLDDIGLTEGDVLRYQRQGRLL